MSVNPDLSLAIMAGGQSSRMGRDKSFVELDGKPIIQHIIERTANLGQSRTFIITNKPDVYAHLNLPCYRDVLPDKGSLGGIYSAIHHSTTAYTLVIACDMPFISPDLLNYMIDLTKDNAFDVIVPRVDNFPQGLHAIYHKNCAPQIRERLDADRLKVIGFYGNVRVRYLDEPEYQPYDPDGSALDNINTPDDLAQARKPRNKQ